MQEQSVTAVKCHENQQKHSSQHANSQSASQCEKGNEGPQKVAIMRDHKSDNKCNSTSMGWSLLKDLHQMSWRCSKRFLFSYPALPSESPWEMIKDEAKSKIFEWMLHCRADSISEKTQRGCCFELLQKTQTWQTLTNCSVWAGLPEIWSIQFISHHHRNTDTKQVFCERSTLLKLTNLCK